jgi:hypothetical protein
VHLHGADRGVSSTLTVAYNPSLSAAISSQIGIAAYQVASGAAPAGVNKRLKLEQIDLSTVISGGGMQATLNQLNLFFGPCDPADAACTESLNVCFADGMCHPMAVGDPPAVVFIVKNWSPGGLPQTETLPILSFSALPNAAVP